MRILSSTAGRVLIIGFLLLAVFLGGLLFIGYFRLEKEPDCATYPVQVAASPGGTRRAEQEQEACASTDQLHTRVLVSGSGQAPVTAFEITTGKALGSMSMGQRSVMLGLRWEGEGRLVITHPAQVSPKLPAGTYGGVEVRLEVSGAGK